MTADPARGAARSRHGGRRPAAGARPHRRALPREAARGALPVGARPGLRPLEPQRQPGPAREGRGRSPRAARLSARDRQPRSSCSARFSVSSRAGGRRVRALPPRRRPRPPPSSSSPTSRVSRRSPRSPPTAKSVVYAAESGGSLDLFFLRVGGRNPQNLTADSPADDYQPAFSPDGERIAFRSERDGGGIFVMGSTGESVRRLTDFGYNPAWSPTAARWRWPRGPSPTPPTGRAATTRSRRSTWRRASAAR